MDQATEETFLIPLEKELQERLNWLIRLRWLAGTGILLGSAFGLPALDFSTPFLPLMAVGAAVLAYNLVLFLCRKRVTNAQLSLRRTVHLQIGMDWAAVSATVYLTGGIHSPASVAFAFHLIIGAILLSRRACYLLAASAILVMGLLTLLTAKHLIWPYVSPPVPVVGKPREAFEIWLALTVFFLISTYLATSITARLRKKEAALSRSERSLDRAYHEMESLYELGQLVNSTLDINEILSLLAQHAARLLHGKASFIRMFDKSGRRLYIGGSYGLSQAYIDKGPVDVEKSLVDSEALRGGVIQVLEVADDRRFQYREEARREGLRSMLSCPMQAKNRTLGVIRVYTDHLHVFNEQEENLLKNLANLGAVAIENARSYSDLQALDQERVWFARTTHHQLRSPLAAIRSSLDALPFAGSLSETQKALIARARRRIQDAFDMIRDLLDLAAAQRLEDPTSLKPVRLSEALTQLLESAQERSRAKGLEFLEELDIEGCWLRAQPADLERIFSNLLDNAVKYTRAGRIRIRAGEVSGSLEFVVEDTGIGIGTEELESVFEGFYRSASAKASGEMGTGLGLSIVQKLVSRLGGTIAVESEPGRGTRFTVRLPLSPPDQSAEPAREP